MFASHFLKREAHTAYLRLRWIATQLVESAICCQGFHAYDSVTSMLWKYFRCSTAAKGYDCAFCDKSTKIGTLVVLYI